MKNRLLKILFLTTSILFLFCAFSFINLQKAFAESGKESYLFSPSESSSYADYKNSISIDCSGEICLICDNKLIVCSNGTYLTYETVTSPKTVKRIDGSTLLFSDYGSIYTITYDSTAFNAKSSSLKDTSLENIGCNYFDINSKYLVTAFGPNAFIYERSLNSFQFIKKETVSITNDTPICLNENNELFYFLDNNLCKKVIDGNNSIICPATAKNIIANNEYVFLLNNNSISYVENTFNERPQDVMPTEFSIKDINLGFVLGTISNPTAITFKNDNLFIADEHALQEFEIIDNELKFTGFAISKGNTAFNRIDASAFDIEKNGKNIAVIDNNKISLIKNGEEKIFVNHLNDGFNPTNIALGRDKLLVSSSNKYYFVDFENKKSEIKNLDNIQDLIFANNNFYILTNTATNSIVYKIDQMTLENNSVYEKAGLFSNFALDVNGNFIFNENNENKILTDLVGNVFSLKNGKLNGNSLKMPSGLSVENLNIKSFAMDIENKEIYFILDNEEVIITSTNFDNKTISEIIIDENYKTTSENAEDFSFLKVYTIKENANAYQIEIIDKKINYIGLFEEYNENKKEFVLISNIPSPYQDFSIISGYDKNNLEITLLVNNNYMEEKEDYIIDLDAYVYVSTPVDMYYLPIINMNRSFSLIENENFIRLCKNQAYKVSKEVEINNVSFYYGKVEIYEKEITGYIPKDFTVTLLSNSYIKQTFSYIDVKATSLYDNDNNEIIKINETKNIKLIESGDKSSFIEYKENGISYFGYISNESVIKPSNNALKITICLAVLAICAFITTVYFVFIRKIN